MVSRPSWRCIAFLLSSFDVRGGERNSMSPFGQRTMRIAQASCLSEHGDTLGCTGRSSGKNVFSGAWHIVPTMSSTAYKKTTRTTGQDVSGVHTVSASTIRSCLGRAFCSHLVPRILFRACILRYGRLLAF